MKSSGLVKTREKLDVDIIGSCLGHVNARFVKCVIFGTKDFHHHADRVEQSVEHLSTTCLKMGQSRCMQGDLCDGHPGDLLEHRSLIRQLYVRNDMPLKAVMRVLKDEHGINVSYGWIWETNRSTLTYTFPDRIC